jgi:hypothetical protein
MADMGGPSRLPPQAGVLKLGTTSWTSRPVAKGALIGPHPPLSSWTTSANPSTRSPSSSCPRRQHSYSLQGASTAVAAAGLVRTGRGDGVGDPAHRPRSKAGATGGGASAGAGTGAGAGVHAPSPSPAVPAGPTPARKSSKKRGLGADTPAGDDGAPPSPAIPAGHTPGRKSSKQRASSADHGGASGGAATPARGASKKVTYQLPPVLLQCLTPQLGSGRSSSRSRCSPLLSLHTSHHITSHHG